MSNSKKAKRVVKRTSRKPGTLDKHFGEKLRARRLSLVPNISQEELGNAIGISFQQVQKYENGTNRISAAKMVEIAEVLKVDVQYFFDELPTGARNNRQIKTSGPVEMLLAANGPRLIDAFLNLKTDQLRAAVADLVQTLARAG